MSTADKAQNKADDLAGKAKEKFGQATDDQDLKNEGKGDQIKSNLKDAGEKVKDAFRN
ncbi:CsbD family protein [Nocardia goodfellowii]